MKHSRASRSDSGDPQPREQWFEAVLKSIGDAVITTDNAGKITFVNRAAELLTGFGRAEALGKTIGFDSSPRDPSEISGRPLIELPDQAEIEILLDEELALIDRHGAHIPIEYSGALEELRGFVKGFRFEAVIARVHAMQEAHL